MGFEFLEVPEKKKAQLKELLKGLMLESFDPPAHEPARRPSAHETPPAPQPQAVD
jgi:hypothetical protein